MAMVLMNPCFGSNVSLKDSTRERDPLLKMMINKKCSKSPCIGLHLNNDRYRLLWETGNSYRVARLISQISEFDCNAVQSILVEKYGLSAEDAGNITQSFLRNFRKCPESSDMPLDDWRILLWNKALGERYSHISNEVYVQWLHLRYKYLAPSEEVISVLESLRKDYYTALISNGKTTSQWEKITRLHLVPFFDCILVSGDLPWEKPSKQIFLKACTHLGVRPEECIMVGDKLETDILGAVQAGLAANIWIPVNEPGYGQFVGDIVPDFTIHDVTELLDVLSGNHVKKTKPPAFYPDFEDCNSNSSDGS